MVRATDGMETFGHEIEDDVVPVYELHAELMGGGAIRCHGAEVREEGWREGDGVDACFVAGRVARDDAVGGG